MLWKRRAPWQGGCRAFDGLPCTARAIAKQAPRRAYLHANLGGTDDWPIKFTGTEGHTPELCRLLNELQGEMERGGTGRDASNSPPLTESGNQQILSKQPQGRDRAVFHQLQQNAAGSIQADSEARRCRGDEVSKGQHCKSRKEKTLEVRVQVSRSPQLGFPRAIK
jgi:hypothetical protein